MTVLLALKKNKKVWIASDSRIKENNHPFDYDPTGEEGKLIFLESAVIAFAGELVGKNQLVLFLKSNKKAAKTKFENSTDVFSFFREFQKFNKESELPECGNEHILVTRDKIFTIDSDGAVMEHPEYVLVGSGAGEGTVLMEYVLLYDRELKPDDMIRRVLGTIKKVNVSCGGSTIVVCATDKLGKK